jgi:tetratricopeptide (TPR) repeat protein
VQPPSRALRTGAPSYEFAFNLAGAELLNGDPARSLDAYDEALTLWPDSLPALRQAAGIAERQGELERSLSYWMRARKIEPNDAEILLGFGRTCLKMDLLEDAEPALIKAAALRPESPSYQYTLAAAKVGKRQYEAAQALLEPLVAKRPDDSQLRLLEPDL